MSRERTDTRASQFPASGARPTELRLLGLPAGAVVELFRDYHAFLGSQWCLLVSSGLAICRLPEARPAYRPTRRGRRGADKKGPGLGAFLCAQGAKVGLGASLSLDVL